MKTIPLPRCTRASTMTEVLITVATVVLLASVLLPMIARPKRCGGGRINCINNLKQVGLAFRIWSIDNDDSFPWAVPAIEGGSLEHATNIQVFRNFLPALHELSTPKILTCVEDRNRTRATNWSLFDNSNLSYFVGLDSDETKPTTILSGDRTISTNGNMTPGVWQVASNGPVVWAKGIHGNGCGNIGLADGSVQQDSNGALQKHLQAGQLGTNRFAVP